MTSTLAPDAVVKAAPRLMFVVTATRLIIWSDFQVIVHVAFLLGLKDALIRILGPALGVLECFNQLVFADLLAFHTCRTSRLAHPVTMSAERMRNFISC